MPSKYRQIQFRLPWLAKRGQSEAGKIARAVLGHPSIKEAIEHDRCPVCGKPFDECEYFKGLEDD